MHLARRTTARPKRKIGEAPTEGARPSSLHAVVVAARTGERVFESDEYFSKATNRDDAGRQSRAELPGTSQTGVPASGARPTTVVAEHDASFVSSRMEVAGDGAEEVDLEPAGGRTRRRAS